jgi:predicted nucleic acid-binding protein
VTVLDACAILAFLRNEPAAAPVARLLHAPTVVTAANAGEVVDQLIRVFGHEAESVAADLGLLAYLRMRIVPVTDELGVRAGELRARHYHRVRSPVSLADCCAAAVALELGRPLATSDAPLAALIRAEGGAVQPLPDSAGRLT